MANRKCRWRIYKDRRGFWRWRLIAPNGRNIANSGESYVSREGARKGIRAVCRCCKDREFA
jgi:uncharacterized protein YegP (UPF0339 family)